LKKEKRIKIREMNKLNFYIDVRNANKKGLIPIKASVNIPKDEVTPGKRYITVTHTVGHIKKAEYWMSAKNKVNSMNGENYKELNQQINRLKKRAARLFEKLQDKNIELNKGIVTKLFKNREIEGVEKISLWNAFDKYIDFSTNTKSAGTVKPIIAAKNKLQTFQKETGYHITFDSIDLNFLDKFQKWLLIEKKHSHNHYTALIRRMKAFMNWSKSRGFNTNNKYKQFKVAEKEGSIIYLTMEELKHLVHFQFEKEVHGRVRDFYCFGCITGLRYSDLSKLTNDNIMNERTLSITHKKTKRTVYIPMNDLHLTIIKRYEGARRLLPKYSNQRINTYIKEVCEIAELNTRTEFKGYTGTQTTIEYYPKYKLINTHTARKTFICNAFDGGMDINDVKAITGIRNETTLRRYLEVTERRKIEKMKNVFGNI
jgi:site-specific recombinase XerD